VDPVSPLYYSPSGDEFATGLRYPESSDRAALQAVSDQAKVELAADRHSLSGHEARLCALVSLSAAHINAGDDRGRLPSPDSARSVPLPERIRRAGVYVVSTAVDAADSVGLAECPLDPEAVAALVEVRPEATVDGAPADVSRVGARLASMWPAGEPVVYIGLAGTSTRRRVDQFYRTPIGARAPHAGGWPVKVLDTARLWVHFGSTPVPAVAEAAMVDRFVVGVSPDIRGTLVDPSAPLPFANLAFPAGRRRRHGFEGVKASKHRASEIRASRAIVDLSPPTEEAAGDIALPTGVALTRPSQNVTAKDLAAGQLRVPRGSKSIFPALKASTRVELGGHDYVASWNPNTDGDKERSGVIRVGRAVLARYLTAGGPRTLETTSDGYRIT
jgi:hypothetical protein